MNLIDLHVHTVASRHAFNTINELATLALERGMRGIAITDHGPAARDTTSSPYFDVLCTRGPSRIGSLRIFKGIEANILSVGGKTDVPRHPGVLKNLDLILAYMHPITVYRDRGREKNTKAILNALSRGPGIDVLAHPVTHWYEIDPEAVARAAASAGCALELNENTLRFNRFPTGDMERLIAVHLEEGGHFVISSDTHVDTELGQDENARAWAARCGIPDERIITESLERTEEFVQRRKRYKKVE